MLEIKINDVNIEFSLDGKSETVRFGDWIELDTIDTHGTRERLCGTFRGCFLGSDDRPVVVVLGTYKNRIDIPDEIHEVHELFIKNWHL